MTDEPAVRVEHACRHLLTTGAAITFDAVAAHTGIGRDALTLTGLQVQIDQLRLALEAVAAKTGRHEEELRNSTAPTAPNKPTTPAATHQDRHRLAG